MQNHKYLFILYQYLGVQPVCNSAMMTYHIPSNCLSNTNKNDLKSIYFHQNECSYQAIGE